MCSAASLDGARVIEADIDSPADLSGAVVVAEVSSGGAIGSYAGDFCSRGGNSEDPGGGCRSGRW